MTRLAKDRPGSASAAGPAEPDRPPDLWRLAAGVERVAELHRLLGDFCHDFRNRLNSLQLSLYLAGEADARAIAYLGPLQARYRDLLALVERLQLVCRPIRLGLMELPLGLLIQDRAGDWSRRAEARGLGLELRPPREEAAGQFDPTRLGQALDELATWRLATAGPGTRFLVAWRAGGGRLCLEWSEAGAAEPEDAGLDDRGVLPLAILSRVASAHGGGLDLASSRPLSLRLSWPTAPPTAAAVLSGSSRESLA